MEQKISHISNMIQFLQNALHIITNYSTLNYMTTNERYKIRKSNKYKINDMMVIS